MKSESPPSCIGCGRAGLLIQDVWCLRCAPIKEAVFRDMMRQHPRPTWSEILDHALAACRIAV